jgi:tetrahydromethanopterin S-methyltransferase subunit C
MTRPPKSMSISDALMASTLVGFAAAFFAGLIVLRAYSRNVKTKIFVLENQTELLIVAAGAFVISFGISVVRNLKRVFEKR